MAANSRLKLFTLFATSDVATSSLVFSKSQVRLGGEEGIRTLDALASIRAFQARALDQLCDLTIASILYQNSILK